MNTRMGSAVVVLMLVLAAGLLRAHHSVTALFDVSKKFTLKGTLTKLDWRNPHSALSIEATNDRGELESWVIQTASLGWFTQNHIGRSDFEKAIGQTVTVEVHRARDGNLLGALLKITLPDGKVLTSNPTQ